MGKKKKKKEKKKLKLKDRKLRSKNRSFGSVALIYWPPILSTFAQTFTIL